MSGLGGTSKKTSADQEVAPVQAVPPAHSNKQVVQATPVAQDKHVGTAPQKKSEVVDEAVHPPLAAPATEKPAAASIPSSTALSAVGGRPPASHSSTNTAASQGVGRSVSLTPARRPQSHAEIDKAKAAAAPAAPAVPTGPLVNPRATLNPGEAGGRAQDYGAAAPTDLDVIERGLGQNRSPRSRIARAPATSAGGGSTPSAIITG